VAETLGAVRAANPGARVWAVFEPRSASSCRRVFQEAFAASFGAADRVLLAPVFRMSLPESERLSLTQLERDLTTQGIAARAAASLDEIIETVAAEKQPGDLVILMSNGGFGGIHRKLLDALGRDGR
jgi:UDP-N-acetylmuramate: L-alanyl-gamma-D-glutamyl-meso-diaminopimelate ligase